MSTELSTADSNTPAYTAIHQSTFGAQGLRITEAEWSVAVESAARDAGWMVVFASAARSDPGWPDLTLLHPSGRVVFAELKTELGVLSPHQLLVIERLRRAGQVAEVWRPSSLGRVRSILNLEQVEPPPAEQAAPFAQPWGGTDSDRMAAIEMVVCDVYSVSIADLRSKARNAQVAWARQVAMWVARRRGLSLSRIGRHFDRDHSTVLHACRKVEAKADAVTFRVLELCP